MFETSVVRAHAMEARGKVSLLTVSIAAHSAVVLGALVFSVATVNFPKMAPDEIAHAPMFARIEIPPPLGRPDGGGPRPAQQPQQRQAAPPPPNTITAPATVPDSIPQVDTPSTATDIADGPGTGSAPGPIGRSDGIDGGIGDLNAPPVVTTPPVVENRIYTVGEVKPPVVIHRVDPNYPPALVRAKVPGKVAVRCIIDKNGRIRDAQVVYATMPPFGESVLRALKDWRYQPASLQGRAVDCYLDLTVDFGVR